MRCHVVVNVTPEVRQRGTVLLDKPDSVEAIKASPLKTRVSLKGKIVKIRPLQKIGISKTGEEKELLNVRLKDNTGVIPISLWGKHATTHQALKVGDCISVEKGEKAVFQNKPTVNTWEDSTTITLLTEDMTEITDSDDETAHQSASPPPGTTTGEWVSLGNITKYEACKEKRCYLKKLTIDNVCPTCGKTYSVKCPSTMALIATVGLQLTYSSEVKTAIIFTNALKVAYTQLCPGASLPDSLKAIEDSFFAALPKMCQMVINANNVVTDITLL
ncbi:uncharacterized protein LOC132759280 [Ruditapes philippinarum]|uniref:uncharacterized protein LOC132759280 n=1 Tax=Ruditapes philippinarum TaxID=129788 RepID=UPI00295BB380|nr:uncharacterized protein LOC132759280 [Ruditapes philippinarum]